MEQAKRGARRSQSKEDFYRRLLAKHARSNLTVKAFAAKRGIPYRRVLWWRGELARRDRAREQEEEAPGELTLVPVAMDTASRAAVEAAVTYEVLLRSGRILRVPEQFNAEPLARLVGVLESSC